MSALSDWLYWYPFSAPWSNITNTSTRHNQSGYRFLHRLLIVDISQAPSTNGPAQRHRSASCRGRHLAGTQVSWRWRPCLYSARQKSIHFVPQCPSATQNGCRHAGRHR
jgi:hypothetical protein